MTLRERLVRRRFLAQMRREVRPERFGAFADTAVVHPPLHVEGAERIAIGPNTYVLSNATFSLGPGGSVAIGARTYLGRDLTVVAMGAMVIGDDVMGSDRLVFCDTAPAPEEAGVPVARQRLAPARPVVVEDGVFLGTGAMVLAGVRVGAGSLVGAGAVVTRDVPPHSVVAGNPARVVRHYDAGRGEWVAGAPVVP